MKVRIITSPTAPKMPYTVGPWHKIEAVEDGKVIGKCFLSVHSPETGRIRNTLYLHYLFVEPEHRNMKVGSFLLAAAKNIASQKKMPITLYALEMDEGKQEDLFRFYEREKFYQKWADNINYLTWDHNENRS